MKKNSVVFLLWGLAILAMAQGARNSFLFKEYQPAKVFLASGSYTEEKINFNLIENQLYFLDKRDGLAKIIDRSIVVDSIVIGSRKFLFAAKSGLREVVCKNPLLCLKYNPQKRVKASVAGYGGTSETAKVTSYSQLRNDGTEILKESEFVITEIDPVYWITKDGKEREFTDLKSLIKIYPDKKDILNQHDQKKNINFKNVEDVVALCKYIQGK